MYTSTVNILVILVMSCMFSLQGCSSKNSVPTSLFIEGADTFDIMSIDSDVLKEMVVMQTLRNRDAMISKSTSAAGFKSTWKQCERTVFYPGMKEPLLVSEPCLDVSYTPTAEFKQKLPTAPSVSPGYAMASDITKTIVKGSLLGYGIYTAGEVVSGLAESTGTDYSGSTFNQSFNPGNGNTNIGTNVLPDIAPIE